MRAEKILLMLVLVLAAGCADQQARPQVPQPEPSVVPDTGIKIIYLLPDYTNLYSKDSFRLNLQVQNVGDAKAQNVNAELHKYGNFQLTDGQQKKLADSLEPPDVSTNSPGETAETEWQVKTPETSASFDYNFGVKIKYDYRTEAWTDGVILSRERWKTLNQLGKAVEINTGTTIGPIQVSVSTRETVLPAVEGIAEKTFPVQVKLQNMGGGVVNSERSSCNTQGVGCVDYVYLYIPTGDPTTTFSLESCSPASTNTTAGDTTTVTFSNVSLMGGSSAYLSCNIKASSDLLAKPDLEKSFRIKAGADYRYQVEGETMVTVQGESVKR